MSISFNINTTNKGLWRTLANNEYEDCLQPLLEIIDNSFAAEPTIIDCWVDFETNRGSIEDDGKGGTIVSLPGGHMDLEDNGIINSLNRKFGEEVVKDIKINKSKLKLVTIRQVPSFSRLGDLFKNQDVWFLYKLELSKSDCNKIINSFEINEEVKTLKLMNLEELSSKVDWLSKDIIQALHNSTTTNFTMHYSKKAYKNSEGYFFY